MRARKREQGEQERDEQEAHCVSVADAVRQGNVALRARCPPARFQFVALGCLPSQPSVAWTPMHDLRECYRILDVEPGASLDEVKQAYRDQVRVWHPDRFRNDPKLQAKAQEKLKLINLSYERLCQEAAADSARKAAKEASRKVAEAARRKAEAEASWKAAAEANRKAAASQSAGPAPEPPRADASAAQTQRENSAQAAPAQGNQKSVPTHDEKIARLTRRVRVTAWAVGGLVALLFIGGALLPKPDAASTKRSTPAPTGWKAGQSGSDRSQQFTLAELWAKAAEQAAPQSDPLARIREFTSALAGLGENEDFTKATLDQQETMLDRATALAEKIFPEAEPHMTPESCGQNVAATKLLLTQHYLAIRRAAENKLVGKTGEVIGQALTKTGANALRKAAAGITPKIPLIERALPLATQFAGAEGGQQAVAKYVDGDKNASVIEGIGRGAATDLMMGLIPWKHCGTPASAREFAKQLAVMSGIRAPSDDAIMAITNATLDTAIHGKKFDTAKIAKEGFAGVLPFVIQNALLHGLSAMAKTHAEAQVKAAEAARQAAQQQESLKLGVRANETPEHSSNEQPAEYDPTKKTPPALTLGPISVTSTTASTQTLKVAPPRGA